MKIKTIPTGLIESNSYVIYDAGEAAVIDAGADHEDILRAVESEKLAFKYIIFTHAHVDHVLEADALRKATGARTIIHESDAPLLGDPVLNCSAMFGWNKVFGPADMLVKDGDSMDVGGVKLQFINTPGHTPGSICILADQCLFSGDTLFRLGVGRTDLGAGDPSKLATSLKRLMELEDSVVIYPGHGPVTDIGCERRKNPFYQSII